LTHLIYQTGTTDNIILTGLPSNRLVQTGGIPHVEVVSTAGGKTKKRGVALTDNEPYIRPTITVQAESTGRLVLKEFNKINSKLYKVHRNYSKSIITPVWRHGGLNTSYILLNPKQEAHSKLRRLTESKSNSTVNVTHRMPELIKDLTVQKESLERLKRILKIQSLISSL